MAEDEHICLFGEVYDLITPATPRYLLATLYSASQKAVLRVDEYGA